MAFMPFNIFAEDTAPESELPVQESSSETSSSQENSQSEKIATEPSSDSEIIDDESDSQLSCEFSEEDFSTSTFAIGDGDGSQANPYIIDLADTTTIPADCTVTPAGSPIGSSNIFELTGAGKYYTISGGVNGTPTDNSIMIDADNITINLNGVYIRTEDKTRAPLNTQNYNVTLDAISGSSNSFVNWYLDFNNPSTYSAGILHSPEMKDVVADGILTILGSGKIFAEGRHQGAGIGGGYNCDGGNISILGDVTVEASGDANGAGIGSGTDGKGGSVKISGNAVVKAQGGSGSAGIGGAFGSGGKVEISGGTVIAKGGGMGAGIGSGRCVDGTSSGEIIISGGVVTAIGGDSIGNSTDMSGGAGLGTGGIYTSADDNISAGKITITGGTVFAYGGENAPGIGIPYGANSGNWDLGTGIISSGNVYSVAGFASGAATDTDIADGAMQMSNGQVSSLPVYQNLLAIDGKNISEKIDSFTASDASWYGITDSASFVLNNGGVDQAYISVWLPEVQQKETVVAKVNGINYRGIYDRKNPESLEETLYPQRYLSIDSVANGTTRVTKVNNVVVAENSSVPDLYPGDIVEVTAVPSAEYVFDGWQATGYTLPAGDEVKDTVTIVMPASAVEITPRFKGVDYQISYDLAGGSNAAGNPAIYGYGVGVTGFAPASKSNYDFVGWYADVARTIPVTEITILQTGNMTLYAKFKGVDYQISYDLAGGSNAAANPTTYEYSIGVTSFAPASKSNYDFVGWYADVAHTIPVTEITTSQAGNMTLYADWKQKNVSSSSSSGPSSESISASAVSNTPAVGGTTANSSSSKRAAASSSKKYAEQNGDEIVGSSIIESTPSSCTSASEKNSSSLPSSSSMQQDITTSDASDSREWSLISLILTGIGVVLGVLALVFAFSNNRKKVMSIFVAIVGVLGVFLFFALNVLTAKMVWFDKSTILFVILVVVQIILFLLLKRKSEDDELEEGSD